MDEKYTQSSNSFSGTGDKSGGSSFFVSSIVDARELIEKNMHPAGANVRRQLVDYITDPSNRVLSESDTYHNLIMVLFRNKDYDLALKVCDFALSLAPYNCDILANALRACGKSSQFERSTTYLERSQEIPKEKWSYRLFLYSITFFQDWFNAYPTHDEYYEKAMTLAVDYTRVFPYHESGYNKQAELLISMNRRDEAIALLKKAVFEIHPDPQDTRSYLVCSQCCVSLLEMLDDSNDYKSIIEICDRGLRDTTQEQPSASIGYFMYRKAMAMDAQAHKENFKVPSTIEDALKYYQSAYDLNQDRQYSHTIEKRYTVLRSYAPDTTPPLVKRKLYVLEEERNQSKHMDA